MPPKGKERMKRRSRRLAGLTPNGSVDPEGSSNVSNGNHQVMPFMKSQTQSDSLFNDEDMQESDTETVVEASVSSSSSPELTCKTVNLTSSNVNDHFPQPHINHNSSSTESSNVGSPLINIVDISSHPELELNSQSFSSPNTELLASNIEISSHIHNDATQAIEPVFSSNSGTSSSRWSSTQLSFRRAQSSVLSSQRTLQTRSRGRRCGTQSRAIMSAYRSIPSSLPVKGESYCDCVKTSRDLTCTCGEEDTVFEWCWDTEGKSAACDLKDDGRHAIFHVSYSSGTAAVKGTLPMHDRQYFWEVKMTSPVYGTDMMVGIGTENVNLDSFRHTFTSLLGKDGDSWGLSYYGRFQQKGQFEPVDGAKFGQGSIIGLHVDMWHGTLSYYKNRKPLGVLCSGLQGKTVFPMVSSTAARTTMKIIKACSFQTSLQFLCCQALRKMVPKEMDVMDVVDLPPGLRAFLANNLSWLLRPNELHSQSKNLKKKKRLRGDGDDYSSSDDDGAPSKRMRYVISNEEHSDGSDFNEDVEAII